MSARFPGRTGIVTGASRGLGVAARLDPRTAERKRAAIPLGRFGVADEITGAVLFLAAGPWHSAAMAGAVSELRAALHAASRGPLACPLIANRDGRVAAPDRLPDRLAEQLIHPVCWTRTLETLSALGITDHVTVGPGTISRGLSRKWLGESTGVHGTEDAANRARTLAALRGSCLSH